MREENINIFIQSKAFGVLCFIAAIAMTIAGWNVDIAGLVHRSGIIVDPLPEGITLGIPAIALNYTLVLGIAVMMFLLNRKYSFLGGHTLIEPGIFLLMQASVPTLYCQWIDGTAVALIVLYCMRILYSLFESEEYTPQVFVIFAIISAAALLQSAFLYLIPLFFLGLVQVRTTTTLKGILAALLGIVTPIWIGIGLHIISLDSFTFPEPRPIFMHQSISTEFIFALVTGLCGIAIVIANMFTLIKYRLKFRIYNGFTLLIIVWSLIMITIDSDNIMAYIPLLNAIVAMQFAHWFNAKGYKRRYLAILFIVAALAGTLATFIR